MKQKRKKEKKKEVYLYRQTETVERDAGAYRSIFSPLPILSRFQNTMFQCIMHGSFCNLNTVYENLTMRATVTKSLKTVNKNYEYEN